MSRVAIVGGGFAGLAAAMILRREAPRLSVTLLDRNPAACYLPLLPDCIGRAIPPELLLYAYADASRRYGFDFWQRQVTRIDCPAGMVYAGDAAVPFDYLVCAAGMQPNFYGNRAAAEHAYCLATIDDARRLAAALAERTPVQVVVAGGGYTGVEVATAVWRLCRKRSPAVRVLMVERAAEILAALPPAASAYVRAHLRRLNIDVACGVSVAAADSRSVRLSDGRVYADALLVWTAGVQAAPCVDSLPGQKNQQGRVIVDDYLRCAPRCFVAGDAAVQTVGGVPLRMSVQAALTQGSVAARNIIAAHRNQPLRACRPRDLGWVVPMADNNGWGIALGIPVRGPAAVFLHYLMCLYRGRGGVGRALALAGAIAKG
ncbi:MAG: FAD-dependent oxidoreductase [Candidatus Omnitrophica bacterium]|nr:FAD-dependent oxidoreductase [Candidatus Omnitrophota bacterium]